MQGQNRGFTLIELLVVVAMLVVLLALLMPAMDQAIYQAELAVCGGNLRGLGQGMAAYVFDHKRYYPPRYSTQGEGRSMKLSGGETNRDNIRPVLRPYIPLNKLLVDPLCSRKVDLEKTEQFSQVYASYGLWFGWRITDETRGMSRLGDRFSYKGTGFNVWAADLDVIRFGGFIQTSHPDDRGLLTPDIQQDTVPNVGVYAPGVAMTYSIWMDKGLRARGRLDRNVLFDDQSVSRYAKVKFHVSGEPDERMVELAERATLQDEGILSAFLPPAD